MAANPNITAKPHLPGRENAHETARPTPTMSCWSLRAPSLRSRVIRTVTSIMSSIQKKVPPSSPPRTTRIIPRNQLPTLAHPSFRNTITAVWMSHTRTKSTTANTILLGRLLPNPRRSMRPNSPKERGDPWAAPCGPPKGPAAPMVSGTPSAHAAPFQRSQAPSSARTCHHVPEPSLRRRRLTASLNSASPTLPLLQRAASSEYVDRALSNSDTGKRPSISIACFHSPRDGCQTRSTGPMRPARACARSSSNASGPTRFPSPSRNHHSPICGRPS
ncbi:MAG: hypothetical protein BWY79_01097 [Actinobacteria bacterium ADurb.Bin444]|nr:MAG: hypothetical protein BWY79_01097 [Actinobacteria bacterium ADurb.Bin444]